MKMISVIIPSFNSRQTIERCLESVLRTGYRSLQIIVVDDCSTDDSPDLIRAMQEKNPAIIRLVFHETNRGPATARNTGAKSAQGDYLFFLDSDTEMLPDALHRFAETIENADAVTGIYHFESLNSGFTPTYKALLNYYFFSRKGVIPYEVFDASRAGIRASVFHDLGGFSEALTFGMDYENEEFGYRLCERYRNLLDPSVAVRHQFPDFWKLSKTYFLRVALWMEIFLHRRRFESGGVTSSDTGIATVSLFLALLMLPAGLFSRAARRAAIALFLVYCGGYAGFWKFVAMQRPSFIIPSLILNIYFSAVIAAGASFGLIRSVTGLSTAGNHMQVRS